jgi:sucrose-6F-phosphate phosphohydrolase
MIQPLLICTDLDRTLIPNGEQPESPQARPLFRQLVSNPQITLAYVTGRDKTRVQEAIAEYELPIPDFVIADVGSTIYEIQNNQWLRLTDWDEQISVDWQYKTQLNLVTLFNNFDQIKLQEITKQGLHKLSYYVSLETEREPIITKIQAKLDTEKIQANIIWSIDEKAQIGLLDVLPLSANKYHAIAYLMKNQNFTLDNTIFSGDSGNDLDVLMSPIKSILVANTHLDVKEKIQSEIDQIGLKDSIYIAQGKSSKLNGNYSAGILEGIFHYFPDVQIESKN